MEIRAAGERIATVTEARRNPPGDGPDGWGGGCERLAAIDVHPDVVEPPLDRAEYVAHDTEGTLGRPDGATENWYGEGVTAHRTQAHALRQSFDRRVRRRVDNRASADVVHGGLKRGDLGRKRAGCFAVARVLALKDGVRRTEVGDRRLGAPTCAKPNQHRKGKKARDCHDRRTQRNREPPHGAGRAIDEDDRVMFGSQIGESVKSETLPQPARIGVKSDTAESTGRRGAPPQVTLRP